MTTTITDINGTAQELVDTRTQIATLKETLGYLKTHRDSLQEQMLSSMKANKLKQWKTSESTISRSEKSDIKVINEEELVLELNSRKLLNQYFVTKLDTTKFKSFAMSLLKNTGEVLRGTKPVKTEFISIRKGKSKEEPHLEPEIKTHFQIDSLPSSRPVATCV